MLQSTADEGTDRAGEPAPATVSQSADPAVAVSGDALLAAQAIPAEQPDSGNAADPSAPGGAEHASAPTPAINDDGNGAYLTAALPSDASDDAGGRFHLSAAADAFWFKLDDDGSIGLIVDGPQSADDQDSVDPAGTQADSGTEVAFAAKSASLFHDHGAGGAFGGSENAAGDGSHIAFGSGALSIAAAQE